jgi:hypothetical protein
MRGRSAKFQKCVKFRIPDLYEPPDPDEFDALIDEGIKSEHFPLTDAVWEGIRQRGRKLAQQPKKGKYC